MKKLYTILGAILFVGSASAQAYLGKDFEDQSITSGGFTTQVVTGTSDWFTASFSGNYFAKMSNFSGGSNSPSETWLITPGIDLTAATAPIFSFSSSANFNGADIEIYTSTDYDGMSNPNSSGTWTPMIAPLSQGSYDWVNSGELPVTNTSTTTFFAFKYTGTANDGKTWQLDSIFVAEAGTPYTTTITGGGGNNPDVSIYEIQFSTATPADSPYEGQVVNTGGIVTFVRDDGGYYLASGNGPYSGIYVYDNTNTVALGDSVTLTAEVDEYFDLTELKNITNLSVVTSGNFFFSNSVSTAMAGTEAYEGLLISTCGTVTNVDQYDNYTVNDGSGDVIGDPYQAGYHASGSNIDAPTVGNIIEAKGILDYSFGEFKILPRTSADIANVTSCNVSIAENSVEYNLYPNPTNNVLNIELEGAHTLKILDAQGRLVVTKVIADFQTVDVSNLSAGIYTVVIANSVKKFVKK